MNQLLYLYGFGSFFRGGPLARDIDLLIVHQDTCLEAIRFAIYCKSLIKEQVTNAHIVLLSQEEEKDIDFIFQSKAVFLEAISDSSPEEQIEQLGCTIVKLTMGIQDAGVDRCQVRRRRSRSDAYMQTH